MVSSCDEKANACILRRNSNATIALDFTLGKLLIVLSRLQIQIKCNQLHAFNQFCCILVEIVDGNNVPEVTTVVHGIIMGVEMPFPLTNPNACVDSGLACPLEKEKSYEYAQTLPVLRSYPKVNSF